MRDRWLGLIELSLIFGLVLVWAVRELYVLRRDQRAADEAARLAASVVARASDPDPAPAPADPPSHR